MVERMVSDIGGLPAGEVPREERRQRYWEKELIATVNLLTKRLGITLDEFRRASEEMRGEDYMSSGLYDRRLDGWLRLLYEKGILDASVHQRRAHEIMQQGTRDHVP